MKRHTLPLIIAGAALLSACTLKKAVDTSAAKPDTTVDSLKALVPRLLKEAEIPGLSIALIQDGSLHWTGSFGISDTETNAPVTDSTVFEAASLGKPVFAYAVLKLADKGVLDLNKPLVEYLPHTSKFTDERIGRITARMVLSHQTGLPNWRGADTLRTYFEPGERFSYSGEGVNLLQQAVEAILDSPLDQVMKELVFEPLQMESSSFSWRPSFDRLKANPHNEYMEVGAINKPLEADAASTFHTTASDYGRFMSAALRGDGLKDETFQKMVEKQAQIDENCVTCLQQTAPPSLSGVLGWGLGWGIQETEKGPAIWHRGDNGGFKGYAVGLLNEKDGVVFFANGANGLSITEALIEGALDVSQPSVKWLTYEPYNTATRSLLRTIVLNRGGAIQELKERSNKGVSSRQYAWIAQQLYNRKLYAEAIELYLLSLEKDPLSLTAHTGIAQVYLKLKDREAALAHYKSAQELSPENKEIADTVNRLEKPELKVDVKILDTYVGKYDSPLGRLNVSRENQLLYVELERQSKEELVAESESRFFSPGVKAYFVFSKNKEGAVREMVIEAGDQKVIATRVK